MGPYRFRLAFKFYDSGSFHWFRHIISSFLSENMDVEDTNVCLLVFYYYQDGDWFYLLNHICVYEVVTSSTSVSRPFAISYLTFTPLSTRETSVATYPVDRLRIKRYLAEVSSSMWLRTNHKNK